MVVSCPAYRFFTLRGENGFYSFGAKRFEVKGRYIILRIRDAI
jgi:hypothetical protein